MKEWSHSEVNVKVMSNIILDEYESMWIGGCLEVVATVL